MAFNSFHQQSGFQVLQQLARLCWVFVCLPAVQLPVSAAGRGDVQASSLQTLYLHWLPQMHEVQFQLQKEQLAVECRPQSNQSLSTDRTQTCKQNVCHEPAIYIKHHTMQSVSAHFHHDAKNIFVWTGLRTFLFSFSVSSIF